ncbi:hypothetical protein [Longibacter salinarum]|uniref:hypothetical protein n=1 Tax=Longibacter salinarum TaxID=1850348 RepID=UPI00117ED41A|nr:hypothetical protein [Longibacter salinarum]
MNDQERAARIQEWLETTGQVRDQLEESIREVDTLAGVCDVGPPPEIDENAGMYERSQWQTWNAEATKAERQVPGTLRGIARRLRDLADALEAKADADA